MLESIYPLIIPNLVAAIWSIVFFLPAKWIRWGWLWYLQILITEWIFTSILLSAILILYSKVTIWFAAVILIYLYRRTFTFYSKSITLNSNFVFLDNLLFIIVEKYIFFYKLKPKSKEFLIKNDNPDLKHLIFQIKNPKAVCIHIHGGSWMHGDANQLTNIVSVFHQHQIEVISINYKKYPDLHLNEIISNVGKTFEAICENYPAEQKFILYGRSAGGHIALMLSTLFPEKIEKVVSLYPITDLNSLALNATDNDVLKTKSWIKNVIGGDSDQKNLLHLQLSPSEMASQITAQVLLVHGENDPLIPIQQSDLLFEKMPHISYLRFRYGTHGFDAIWNGLSMSTFKNTLNAFIEQK